MMRPVDPEGGVLGPRVTASRRDVLRWGLVGAATLGGFTGCAAVPGKPNQNAPQVKGGVYSHGATGGGLKDSLSPHFPVR